MTDIVERLQDVAEATGPNEARQIALDAAAEIRRLRAKVAKADALAEAGSVMAQALHGDYIVPGSAAKWDEALTAYREADT